MWYVILSLALVVGGAFTSAFSIVIGKDMLKDIKPGLKPDGVDIMMFSLSAYAGVSLFGLAIYCLI